MNDFKLQKTTMITTPTYTGLHNNNNKQRNATLPKREFVS